MVMKLTAVCLVALALLGSFGAAQKPQSPYKQKPSDPQQQKQTFEKELTWTYPIGPVIEPKPVVPFELRSPIAASTVAVECREDIAHVEVKRDMFGTGQFINPADLTLGACAAVAEDSAAQVLIYQSLLHECGSSLMVRIMQDNSH